MPFPLRVVLALAALYVLYFHGMTAVGLHGPDEPRYAWIGRAMAESGDWITPRLWGQPWFEKPALLYWLIAAGFQLGLDNDAAPRFFLAVLSVAFLFFYFRLLREELTAEAAAFSTAILAASAAWLAYSRTAVTDIPLSVCFALSMLLTLEWLRTGNPRRLPWAGAALGFAILAKGLVPIVLAAPLAWYGRKRIFDLWRLAAPALLIALPWYALCAQANGPVFLEEFFLKHHFSRFATSELQHVQPFWFYIPVLLGAVFPWTPLLALLRRPQSTATHFLAACLLFGFLFFSAAQNKLPGYLLPLLPAFTALLGDALSRSSRGTRWTLAASAALIAFTPAILPALPDAISIGSTSALPKVAWWQGVFPAALAALIVYLLEARQGRAFALAVVALLVSAMAWRVVQDAFPAIDREVSARSTYRAHKNKASRICLEEPRRAFQYGVNYYFRYQVPDCETQPQPIRIAR
ncbi:MAG: glycosyltransferase family 39 protein [Bryobacterales bacterium]|nr:glycosyltransferase family 39 protein [Bryobacterales bacterium]